MARPVPIESDLVRQLRLREQEQIARYQAGGGGSLARDALMRLSEQCDQQDINLCAELAELNEKLSRAESSRNQVLLDAIQKNCEQMAKDVGSGRLGGLQFEFLPNVEVKVRWSQKIDSEGEEGQFTLEMGGASAKYTNAVQRDYGSAWETRTFELLREDRQMLLYYNCNGINKKVSHTDGQITTWFPELRHVSGWFEAARIVGQVNDIAGRSRLWAPFKQLWFTYAAGGGAAELPEPLPSDPQAAADVSSSEQHPLASSERSDEQDSRAGRSAEGGHRRANEAMATMRRLGQAATDFLRRAGSKERSDGRQSSKESTDKVVQPRQVVVQRRADDECPVCMEPFSMGGPRPCIPETLSCSHRCCRECWTLWAAASRSAPRCPLCRTGEFTGAYPAAAQPANADSAMRTGGNHFIALNAMF
eukprot:TRINITY_DN32296_c0_g1_i2.p1 TRINITY_DN32296_c0_g1~~TRINITY_DN32296_c0_g1_i2.p1  ORF type:complete len:420 (+),score=95.20 TRINITY_DN32296_c0_g1_i2:89-1348(+)